MSYALLAARHDGTGFGPESMVTEVAAASCARALLDSLHVAARQTARDVILDAEGRMTVFRPTEIVRYRIVRLTPVQLPSQNHHDPGSGLAEQNDQSPERPRCHENEDNQPV